MLCNFPPTSDKFFSPFFFWMQFFKNVFYFCVVGLFFLLVASNFHMVSIFFWGFFSMVFFVFTYVSKERKKFYFLFFSFQPFFLAGLCKFALLSLSLSHYVCVCLTLVFFSLFLVVCLFLGTVRWRFQNSKCNFPQKLNVCCSCIFIALFFVFFKFPISIWVRV